MKKTDLYELHKKRRTRSFDKLFSLFPDKNRPSCNINPAIRRQMAKTIAIDATKLFVVILLACIGTTTGQQHPVYSCDVRPGQANTTAKLQQLRNLLNSRNLFAYVIFSEDEHQSEYVQPYDERRAWITGFTGSAGTAVVTRDRAALWTDGRYWTQAENQLDCQSLVFDASRSSRHSIDHQLVAGRNRKYNFAETNWSGRAIRFIQLVVIGEQCIGNTQRFPGGGGRISRSDLASARTSSSAVERCESASFELYGYSLGRESTENRRFDSCTESGRVSGHGTGRDCLALQRSRLRHSLQSIFQSILSSTHRNHSDLSHLGVRDCL